MSNSDTIKRVTGISYQGPYTVNSTSTSYNCTIRTTGTELITSEKYNKSQTVSINKQNK